MRVEHLRYLVEVADCGSMSKAAKNLFVTQPAISNAISTLEHEIGWPILERTGSGVQPTTKGKLVVDDARLILRLIHDWNDVLDSVNLDKITGDVYVADSSELGLSFFQDVIMEMNRKYPKLVVHSVPLQSNPLKELNNGRFQMTVLPIAPRHHNTIARYLGHYRWYLKTLYESNCKLLISAQSELADLDKICTADLHGKTIMVYPDFPYRQLLEAGIEKCSVVYEEPLRLVAAAANNDAIAVFPPSQDVLLHEFLSDGVILEKEIADIPLPMEVNLIYSDYFSRTDAGKLMIQAVQDHFSQESANHSHEA